MENNIYDICIIGAGASGLAAAIESSRRGLSVVMIDKNKKVGNKLYATGNGHCNLTNDTYEESSYYGNEFVDSVFESLYRITGLRQRSFIVKYFEDLGIKTTNKNGYIYPSSMQASSVVWALKDAASMYGVEFINNFTAFHVNKITAYSNPDFMMHLNDSITASKLNQMNNGYRPRTLEYIYEICIRENSSVEMPYEDAIYSRSIIIATGGMSQPKLGAADKSTHESLLDSMGIPFKDFRSGLCPLLVNENLKEIAGVRTKCRLNINGKSELGELQISDNSISGIVTFNMSYYAEAGDNVVINLLPKISQDEFIEHFKKIRSGYPDKRLKAFLNGYLNDKLGIFMIRCFYGEAGDNLSLKDVTDIGIEGLYLQLTEWTLQIKKKGNFDVSQASSGGIITNMINPLTMKLSINDKYFSMDSDDEIYATGEVTDVLGKCGGYNLTYAFITGYIAGQNILK